MHSYPSLDHKPHDNIKTLLQAIFLTPGIWIAVCSENLFIGSNKKVNQSRVKLVDIQADSI